MMKPDVTTFSPLDGFFALLRLVALAGGIGWFLVGPTRPQMPLHVAWLFSSFTAYSVALYGLVLYRRMRLERMYFLALFLDFASVAMLVTSTGGQQSIFILAFYLLIGLHAFYFGFKVGLLLGVASSLFYLSTNLAMVSESWVDQLFKIGFMLLTGVAAGLLSDQAKRDRQQIEELAARLQAASRVIEQSEKIALLGRLSAGIAHEINNPVSVISTRTERMLMDAKERDIGSPEGTARSFDNEALIADLEVINKQAHRTASIIRSMLAFSRHSTLQLVPLDINQVVEKAVALIEHRLSEKGLTLNLNLLRHLPKVSADASRLQDVVINILNNAIDASHQGGQIYVISTLSGGSEKVLQIFVSDTGEGIGRDDLEKVFDPFFTTKEVGRGTGLGLYVSYQIIREHGGTISIESEPAQGTTVTISLPVGAS